MSFATRWSNSISLTLCLLVLLPAWAVGATDEDLRGRLRSFLQEPRVQQTFEGETLQALPLLQRFYQMRDHQPAWFDAAGPTADTLNLQRAIAGSSEQGLTPAHYHQQAIIRLLDRIKTQPTSLPPQRLEAELLCSDAYLLLASHYWGGGLANEFKIPAWYNRQQQIDPAAYLTDSLERGRIREDLLDLLPASLEYQGLVRALNHYRAIAQAGGWGGIDAGPKLELGEQGDRILQLRARLQAEQHLPGESPLRNDVFDIELEKAVKRFQARHGLEVDGIVGRATLAALNTPVEQRIRQIRLNLERLRWLPRQRNHKSVRVNIADFRLQAREDDRIVFGMKIIVGRRYRQTPEFSEHMTYLVLNPSWHVPRRIALRDKLPLIQKDPGYLKRNGYVLYRQAAGAWQTINPARVDWHSPQARSFPYRLRQVPGANNALGRIKFMLPNRFNVYLHDTPERELFSRTTRTFSSGCIRLERPLQLAVWVMQGSPDWDQAALEEAIATGRERVVRLPQPIPVDLIYLTAWGGKDGLAQFREDIYRRDDRVATALDRQP